MKIEDDLREALERASRSATPSSDAWDSIDRRRRDPDQSSTQRRLGIILVAAAIAVSGLAVAIKAFDQGGASLPHDTPEPLAPIGSVQTFDLGWDPSESSNAITSNDGYAWVAGNQTTTLVGSDGTMTPIPFEQGPFGLSASSSGAWAVGFEPGSGSYVAHMGVGSANPGLIQPLPNDLSVSSVVATDKAVWVFGGRRDQTDGTLGTLLRVDPNSFAIVKRIELNGAMPSAVGTDPIVYATSADGDALWILTAEVAGGELGKITLVRLDASTYATRVYDPGRVSAVVAGGGAVWLPAEHGVIRLDPATGNTTHVEVPTAHPWPFAATDNSAWYLGGTATQVDLVRLDVDGERVQIGMELHVSRQSEWGSVAASYDGAGTVWLLYENGRLQKVSVGA
jgi:hypothetical protein